MQEKQNQTSGMIRICTHEEMLQESGFDLGSPISGSMRPMIRPRRDSVLFVPKGSSLVPGDVVLYRSHGVAVMHRILKKGEGGYVIRGDNSPAVEWVLEEQIIAVMQGFYRDERYYPKEHIPYRIYAWLWPRLHPLLMVYKGLRNLERRIRRRLRGR